MIRKISFSIFLFSILFSSQVFACNLPLDPKVVVLPDGAVEKKAWGPGIYGGAEGPHVSVIAEEEVSVGATAYIDVSGTALPSGLATPFTIGGRTLKLITLPVLQAVAESKMKFEELLDRNPQCHDDDPDAVSLGGTIKGMKVQGNSNGGRFGEDFNKTGLDSLKDVLPNAGNSKFTFVSGDTRWRAKNGRYKHEGKFYFERIDSTFEFDKSGIMGAPVTQSGGPQGKSSFTFTVPTCGKNTANPNAFYYGCVGKVDMFLKFSGITWTWKEVKEEKNASGTWVQVDEDSFETSLSGEIERTSDGTNEGHPGYFYVKVTDKTPPVYSRMVAPPTGLEAKTGDTLAAPLDITFDVVDNCPIPDGNPIPTDFFYTLAVTEYVSGNYSVGGKNMDKLKFAEYKDRFVWKKLPSVDATFQGKAIVFPSKTDYTALPGIDVPGIGKLAEGPITSSVSTYKATFSIPDKMGMHYAEEGTDTSVGKSGGQLVEYKKGRLKFFVVPKDDGNTCGGLGYTGPGIDTENSEGAKDATEDSNYSETRTTFPGPTLHTPPEEWDVLGSEEDKNYVIGNFGSWTVKDGCPPNVFLTITDTRYNETHIYGNNTLTVDSGTSPFTGYTATVENSHVRSTYPTTFEFAGMDSDGEEGFNTFRSTYGGNSYVFHNHGDDSNGFWCDEDTKLIFNTWGYDNINTYDSKHGLQSGSKSGGPAQCWWGENMTLNFSLIDEPGNGNGSDYIHIFRDPNRPKSLNSGNCSVEVSCTDKGGRSAKVKVKLYVVWNKKEIRGLEERKNRSN